MLKHIKEHFRAYLSRKPWDFCWRIGLESMVVSLLAAFLIDAFAASVREFPDWSMTQIFVAIVILFPPAETLVMHAFPIFILRKLKASFRTQVVIGTIVFALFHVAEGFASLISAGLIGGFYFSFTYAHWRNHSRWKAFWVTTCSHAIHNAIAFCLILLNT